jgi:cytochrome c-type biogenesis protein CcmF
VLVSVHAFASDPSRGLFILAFLGICVGGSLALYAWRGPALRAKGGFDTLSRETFLLTNNLLLLVAAALILIGTLYPLFLDALNKGKISVGPPYFNVVFLIPTIPLLFLMAIGMHSVWKKSNLEDIKQPLAILFAVSLAIGLIVPPVVYGAFHVTTVVGLTAGVWVILSSLYEPFQRLRKRQSLSRGVVGMTIAHIGVGVFAIGVTVTQTYRIEKDIALKPGETVELQGYTFQFNSTRPVQGPNFDAIESEVTISRDGKLVATLHPQKRVYRVQRSPMTEAGIHVKWSRDLFVAMGEDLGQGAWSMRIQYKPMVRYIWLGALIMALGGIVAVTDRRYRTRRATAADTVGATGTAPAR